MMYMMYMMCMMYDTNAVMKILGHITASDNKLQVNTFLEFQWLWSMSLEITSAFSCLKDYVSQHSF